MPKVIFGGAYGVHSQGDDAALLVLVDSLRRQLGDFDGAVVSRHAHEAAYATYGLRSLENFEYQHKRDAVGRWFRGFNYGDDRSHLQALFREMVTGDLLVLGAGNALIDVSIDLLRGPVPYFSVLTWIAKLANIPVMWFGLSVGPLRTGYGQALARLAADMADAITVRDSHSITELKAIGYTGTPTLLPDPVLGLQAESDVAAQTSAAWRQAHSRSTPVIAMSVRSMPPSSELDTGSYVTAIARVGDALVKQYDATLLFVPHCTYPFGEIDEDDRYVARQVVANMEASDRAIPVEEELSVRECLGLYAGATVAVCTRLHSSVFAAIQGVPPVAICYLPKVSSFMRWLEIEEYATDLSDLTPQRVVETVGDAVMHRERLVENIARRVAEGRKQVEQYAQIAKDTILKRRAV